MAQYRYVPDYNGLNPWLVGPEARALCTAAAEEAAVFARSIAPVGTPPDDEHPGRYRDSIHVDATPAVIPARGRFAARAAVAVVAEAPYSTVIEVQRGHHVLKRAAEHVTSPKRGRRV
jgi:hypothetical protein